MTNADKLDVQFDESGEESLHSYRSINRTSVVGFSLGVLSALSLLHWLLLPIAVAAILVCAVALRQIAARPEEFLGRKAALAGIVLAVFFLGFAATREITRRNTLDRQARHHANQWFQLLQEGSLPNLYKAFELEKRYPERQPEGTDLALKFGDPKEFDSMEVLSTDEELMDAYLPRRNFHNFLQRPIVKQIIENGPRSELVFERVVGRNRSTNQDIVILQYTMHYRENGQAKTSRLFVKLGRYYYTDLRQAHWSVVGLAKRLEDL